MGLLSKIRSKDKAVEDAEEAARQPDSNDSDSGEEGAPPPPYSDGQALQASDSKASFADDDSKQDAIYDSLEELDPQSVWLDVRKADKGGTSIVRSGSDDVLYTFVKDKRWTYGNVLMFKGDVPQNIDERTASTSSPPLPFVTLKQSSILLRESTDPQVEPVKYKNRQFLRPRKWYGAPNTFTYQGTDYRIRQLMSWSGKFTLVVADDPEQKPLCMFRPAGKIFGDLRGRIEILPVAVSTAAASSSSSASTSCALLSRDGQPTRLLDLALIAERMVRRYNDQVAAATV